MFTSLSHTLLPSPFRPRMFDYNLNNISKLVWLNNLKHGLYKSLDPLQVISSKIKDLIPVLLGRRPSCVVSAVTSVHTWLVDRPHPFPRTLIDHECLVVVWTTQPLQVISSKIKDLISLLLGWKPSCVVSAVISVHMWLVVRAVWVSSVTHRLQLCLFAAGAMVVGTVYPIPVASQVDLALTVCHLVRVIVTTTLSLLLLLYIHSRRWTLPIIILKWWYVGHSELW